MSPLPAIAVIADAHVHDINANYDWQGVCIDGKQLTLRSWRDTRRSSRVFNESKAALQTALLEIQERGVKHVVLLGDYTDDGQIEATDRFVDFIKSYRDRYGIRFYALPGNHDAFGPAGKHQSTRFVRKPGESTLVTSDPDIAASEPESAILTQKMYCESQQACVSKMSEFGFFRQAYYVYWESPFGQNDSLASRQYTARSADGSHKYDLLDTSYLVEPVSGLWLLMIDANVFEPRNGNWKPSQKKAFYDSSNAGWNSLLHNKPHLVEWIGDVCARAKNHEKTLIAFSHYPIMDAFGDINNNSARLFNDHEMLRRKPNDFVANKLLDIGLRIHFSGHLHVNAHSQHASGTAVLHDYATPSLVAFPAGFKIVHLDTSELEVETLEISSMPLDPQLLQYYQDERDTLMEELSTSSLQANLAEQEALEASNYGEFLYHRMHCRVLHHYLPREWPEAIGNWVIQSTAADLFELFASLHNTSVKVVSESHRHTLQACTMTRLVSDWYCLRHANDLAAAHIPEPLYVIYTDLAERFGDLTRLKVNTMEDFFAVFLGMMQKTFDKNKKIVVKSDDRPFNI